MINEIDTVYYNKLDRDTLYKKLEKEGFVTASDISDVLNVSLSTGKKYFKKITELYPGAKIKISHKVLNGKLYGRRKPVYVFPRPVFNKWVDEYFLGSKDEHRVRKRQNPKKVKENDINHESMIEQRYIRDDINNYKISNYNNNFPEMTEFAIRGKLNKFNKKRLINEVIRLERKLSNEVPDYNPRLDDYIR